MAHVFISYSRQDRAFVRRLADALVRRGRQTWLDAQDIPPSAEWQSEILTSIETADVFLFVISPASIASPNCLREIDHATVNRKRIIPVLYQSVVDADVPSAIARIQRIDLDEHGDLEAGVDALVGVIDLDIDRVKSHTRLATRAQEWKRRDEDRSVLLRGRDLREARRWLATAENTPPAPTPFINQYVQASLRHQTIRRRFAAAGVVLTAGIVVAIVIRSDRLQRDNAIAESRRLTAAASESLEQDPQLAILLAMVAVRATEPYGTAPIREAKQVLHGALSSSHLRLVLAGHEGAVDALAYNVSGTRIASGSLDRTARVWDAATGREQLRVSRFDTVKAVAFSPDGRWLAVASKGEAVAIWDVDTGSQVLALAADDRDVEALAFSPDGNVLATADEGGKLRLWDRDGHLKRDIPAHMGSVSDIAYSPSGTEVATASDDQAVKVWDIGSGRLLATLRGHEAGVTSVAFSPDGRRLVTGGFDNRLIVWAWREQRKSLTLSEHPGLISDVAFSPDGTRIASGSSTSAGMWDATSGMRVWGLLDQQRAIDALAFSPDGRHLVTGSRDGVLQVWEPGGGSELPNPGAIAYSQSTVPVSLSGDGRRLAAVSDYRARIWDLSTDGKTWSVPVDAGSIANVALSEDGTRVATADVKGTATIWDASSGAKLLTCRGHREGVMGVAFTADGRRLATASNDMTAGIWDAATGQLLHTLRGHTSYVHVVAFSRDGTRLVTGSNDKTVKVWDVESGRLLNSFAGHTDLIASAVFRPDGKQVATASWDRTVRLWELDTGRLVATLVVSGRGVQIRGLSYTSDGSRIAFVNLDGTTTVANAETGQEELVLPAIEMVTERTSPDDLFSGFDGRPKKLQTERIPLVPDAVAFSRDGKRLVTAQIDGTFRVYALDDQELLQVARQRALRSLTPEECLRFFRAGACPGK